MFSFDDAYRLLDRALASDEGITVRTRDKAAAINIRHRCYRARSELRREAKRTLDKMDPGWGRSPYDHITIILFEKDGKTFLQFRTTGLNLSELLEEATDTATGEALDIKEI